MSENTKSPTEELFSARRLSAYDANGNTLTDAGGKSYTWDFENRLVQAVVPGTGTTTFKYDPFGRRVQKSGPLGTTNYLYDDANLIEELDGGGSLVARYSQEGRIDGPLSMLRGATDSYYQQDGINSVTSLSNSSGALAETYAYDSFGKLITSTGTVTNPFHFTGRDYDSETTLRYYRARYYDPLSGRFLSEDPAGFYGGFDFYGYVKNDPVDFLDPMGLECEQVSPWTEMPSAWGPNGPSPYLTIQDGVNWVRTGWSFSGPDRTHCICRWVATHARMRNFYRVTVTEQAEFKCGCPPQTEYRTRERTKEYEVDSSGPWLWPSGMIERTTGVTVQFGSNAGTHPVVWPGSVSCLCSPPTP
jgi:RHS repeat-associated protein